MASNPCPNVVQCECLDFPIRNFTQEAGEPPFFCIVHLAPVPPLGENVSNCVVVRDSDVSQDDACDHAYRAAQDCRPPPDCLTPPCAPQRPLFCSDPVVGVYVCPDGSTYFFPIAAGTFCDVTLEQANAVAQSTANNRAAANHFCLNVPCLSPCLNQFASFSIPIVGGAAPFAVELFAGAIPPGMTLVASGRTLGLSGTPSVAGAQQFTLKISDGAGGYLLPTLTVRVLQITPAILPAFTQGAAYSQQLGVVGGSGNYAWKILSGSLPTGVTMSITGLISGTPTSGTATAFSVQVIDLTCEALNKTFFPPRVALVGHSSHTIATIIGYPEYIASTPPKKYKKLTWEGTSEQTVENMPPSLAAYISGEAIPISLLPAGDPMQIASAKYEWSGAGEIDNSGLRISNYQKLFSAMCHADRAAWGTTWPSIVFGPGQVGLPGVPIPQVLKGYCSPLDPKSCAECVLTLQGDVADNSIFDISDFLRTGIISGGGGTMTSTLFEERYTAARILPLDPAISEAAVPSNLGVPRPVLVKAVHNYSATLSEEYTDAIALTNALTFQSNGLVAENRPRTTGLVSSFTAIQFDLQCSNLLPGEVYVATAELWTSTGARTLRSYAFTALGTTHVVSDNLPTPTAQTTILVKNPTLRFA